MDRRIETCPSIHHYRQRFTPRRGRSLCSGGHGSIVEQLMTEERMQPGGLTEVEPAPGDGRWAAAYAGAAGPEVPADPSAALDAAPAARAMFELLSAQNRYAVLHRVTTAQRR